jgi:hypothetical protein
MDAKKLEINARKTFAFKKQHQVKKKHNTKEYQQWRESVTEANRKKHADPETAKRIADGNRKSAQDPVARANRAEANRRLRLDPNWQKAFLEGRKKIDQKAVGKKMASDSEWQRNHKEQVSKLKYNPVFMEKVAKNNKAKRDNPEHIQKHQTAIDKRTESEDWIRKNCRPIKSPYGIFPIFKQACLEYQKKHGGNIGSIVVKIRRWIKSGKKPEWQYLTWEQYDLFKGTNND